MSLIGLLNPSLALCSLCQTPTESEMGEVSGSVGVAVQEKGSLKDRQEGDGLAEPNRVRLSAFVVVFFVVVVTVVSICLLICNF